jgi:putative aldouronate transport system substrate-binding protein
MLTKKTGIRILTIILTACLLLTACSSKKSAAPTDGSTKPSEDAYEISMVVIGSDQKDIKEVETELSKLTKAKINATVKITAIDWGAWSQQTTLMLAGNEKVDLIVTSNTLFNYASQVAKGQLLPLDDLLEKYGKDIKTALGPDFLSAAQIKGKTYGIPSLRDMAVNYGLLARQDLLDKYKVDTASVKTLDDVEKLFATIKQNEPKVTPFVATLGGITPLELLYPGYFDLLGDSLGVLPWNSKELKVVNMYETPEYLDLVKRARKWNQAGYIAKDASTNKENVTALLKAGTAFSSFANLKPGIESQVYNTSGVKQKQIGLFPPVYTTGTISSFMLSIPVTSKNPDKSMQMINLLFSDPAVVNMLDYGIEGKHYAKVSDKVIDFPAGVDSTSSGYNFQSAWQYGSSFLSYVWKGNAEDIWEQTKAFNNSAQKSLALGFVYNAEPVKTEVAAVLNVVSQFKMALETGSVDPDKILPDFIAQMKAAGIDKIIAEKQKQIDEWAATKK